MNFFVFIPVISVFLAIILTGRSIRERRNADELFKRGVKVQGKVVGHKIQVNNSSVSGTVEYPLIQFTTANGQLVQVEKKSQIPWLNNFESITVFYDVSNPQNVVFDSEVASPLPFLLPGVLWMLAIATTLFYFISR